MKKRPIWLNLILVFLPAVLALEMFLWVTLLPQMARGKADFRQLYVSGYMVRAGDAARLYDYDYQLRLQNTLVAPATLGLPYIRPAYQALVFAPISFVSYRAAYFLWMAVNAALLALSFRLLRHRVRGLTELWKPLPLIVLCSFVPLSIAMLQGQDTILLLALLCASLAALEHDRESVAGCLLALGLFKFQIVLPIAFLFVVWKRWKFAKGFFSTALVLAGISLALTGRAGVKTFFDSVSNIHHPVHYERMLNLHALLVGLFGKSFAITLITFAVSAAVWLAVAKWSPVKSGPDALVIAIPAAALVSYYLYIHDWTVLVLPLLWTLNIGMNHGLERWAALLMWIAPLVCLANLGYAYWATLPLSLLFIATATSMAGRELAHGAPAMDALAGPSSRP